MMKLKRMNGRGTSTMKSPKVIGVVLLIGVIAIAGVSLSGIDMIGFDMKNFIFSGEADAESAEGTMSAVLAAYDKDGNLVRKGGTAMSGFYIGEEEIARIDLTVDATFVGINIDWTSMVGGIGALYAYPNGGDVLVDNLYELSSEMWIKNAAGEEIPDNTDYFESGMSVHIKFTIWDEDYYDPSQMPTSYKPIWYIQDIIGDPVIVEADEEAFLIQLRYHLDITVLDLFGAELGKIVDVVGTWQLTRMLAGTFDIVVNDEIDITRIDPRLYDLYRDEPIVNDIIDKDIAPDITIIPIDRTFLA